MNRFPLLCVMLFFAHVMHPQDDRFLPEIDGLRIDRTGYSMIWNEELKIPKLISYELTLQELEGPSCGGARYHADPNLDEYAASAYEGAYDMGYDKGHLLPKRHGSWSEEACIHTSYYSNILPQKKSLNRGPWDELDDRVDRLIRELGTVYVNAGPVPIAVDTLPSGMPVPCGFWKVLLYEEGGFWNKEVYLFSQTAAEDSIELSEYECFSEHALELLLGHEIFDHFHIFPGNSDFRERGEILTTPSAEVEEMFQERMTETLRRVDFFTEDGARHFLELFGDLSKWCSPLANDTTRVYGLSSTGALMGRMAFKRVGVNSVQPINRLPQFAVQTLEEAIAVLNPQEFVQGEDSYEGRKRRNAATLYAMAANIPLFMQDCEEAVRLAKLSLKWNKYVAGDRCNRILEGCESRY